MTLTGTGRATSVPDRLSFSLGVAVTRPDLETALDESNRVMERVLDSLTPYGVRRWDVETTGLSMDPVYDYHPWSALWPCAPKAEQYAAATGQELGAVVALREISVTPRRLGSPTYARELQGAKDVLTALPIRAGHEDLRVTVQVVWEFA